MSTTSCSCTRRCATATAGLAAIALEAFVAVVVGSSSSSARMVTWTDKHGVLSAGNFSMTQCTVLLVTSNVASPCVDVGSAPMTRDGKRTSKVTDSTGFSNAGLEPTTTLTRPCCAPNAHCGRMYSGNGTELRLSLFAVFNHGLALMYRGCH